MIPFDNSEILIPKNNHEKWAVIACDQYTSDRKYWKRCYDKIGGTPSSLKLILPEVYLNEDADEKIKKIHENMNCYLNDDSVFEKFTKAMVYVVRTLPNGEKRHGIVGAIDLECYSYEAGECSLIRPTEQTVKERIPPRVKIRNGAAIELPHVLLLMDNKKKNIIETIQIEKLKLLYDFDLLEGGGHLCGYLIPEEIQAKLLKAMEDNLDPQFPFAVGDGNHSLASAKAYYESIKRDYPDTPARYALCEIVNIHEDSIEFEPIYRVVFNVDFDNLLSFLKKYFPNKKGIKIQMKGESREEELFAGNFAIEELQNALDDYLRSHQECKIDYVHGLLSAEKLSKENNVVSFIFGGIEKDNLFDLISKNGVLPRKTFSMGEAKSKRYYFEVKRI